MKNGSSYVSRPPYATMRQLFDYRGQPCSQGSLLPEPRNEVVLEGGWDISKENLANSSCVRVRVLFLCLNPKNKKKSDGRWVYFKVFLHFILKFKLFDKCFPFRNVVANLPLLVDRCVHPLNENVSEAIVWRFIPCLLRKIVGWAAFEVCLYFTRKLSLPKCDRKFPSEWTPGISGVLIEYKSKKKPGKLASLALRLVSLLSSDSFLFLALFFS